VRSLFRRGIVDRKSFCRFASDPLAVDKHLVGFHFSLDSAGIAFSSLPQGLKAQSLFVTTARLKSRLPNQLRRLVATVNEKEKCASARKKSVKPNIFASYFHTEVICLAGKKREHDS